MKDSNRGDRIEGVAAHPQAEQAAIHSHRL